MSRIPIPERQDAHPDTHQVLNAAEKALGFVPTLHRLMALNPKVLNGWVALQTSLAQTVDLRTRDAIALAVTEVNDCDYCRAAHTYGALAFARANVDEIALNKKGKSGDPKRAAAALFAKTVVEQRGHVSDEDFSAVRAAGWTDADVVAIVALSAQFMMTNLINNVAQTSADFPPVPAAARPA
jgi:uncharacterized peroxidase-related enzyme